jgi:CRISPR-associated protein Cmr4
MPSESLGIFLLAESSIHAGTGSVLSTVDLPIQREKHTDHPIVQHSGVKGCLRELCKDQLGEPKTDVLFGPRDSTNAGLALFKEARVALFPVRSRRGTFAWVTSPMVLARLARDLEVYRSGWDADRQKMVDEFQAVQKSLQTAAAGSDDEKSLVSDNGCNLLPCDGNAVLEEQLLTCTRNADMTRLAKWFSERAVPADYEWWRNKMAGDVVLVSDNVFTWFVRWHTEVEPHVSIGNGGVVQQGPWNEEALPPDTVLYTFISVPDPRDGMKAVFAAAADARDALASCLDRQFQIGGDQTLGKGFVQPTLLVNPKAANEEQR